MKNKSFDCVEMKRKAAVKIYEKMKNMSREEQIAYWKERSEGFIKRHKEARKKLEAANYPDNGNR